MSRPTIRIPPGAFDLVMSIDGRDVLFVDVVLARVSGSESPFSGGRCRLELEALDVRRERAGPPRRTLCPRCMNWCEEGGFHVCSIFRNLDPHAAPPYDFDEILHRLREAAFKEKGTQRSAPPPKPKPPPQITTWRTALGFPESETPALAVAKARYRELISKAHPDAGGAHDAAVALNVAWTAAQKEIGR